MSSMNFNPFVFEDDLFSDGIRVPWKETRLWHRWHKAVAREPKNDFLMVISPSSRTSGSGSGKTTAATALAKRCDRSEGGFNAEHKATLDAGELAYQIIPNAESGSALIFDEAQGAPGTKSVNSRRGMTTESLDAITSILANRDKNYTIIMIVQQLGMLDSLIYPMVDAWLLINKDPKMAGGPEMTHHILTMNDYELKNPDIKTPALEDLSWPKISHDDPDYIVMEQKKQQAKRKRSKDDEDQLVTELPKHLRDEKIRKMAAVGIRQQDIAGTFDISQAHVSRIVSDD